MRLTGTTFIIAAAIALVSNLSSAQAGVMVGDDSVFGVGSITIDTDTGLEWLDWTKSTGRSYNDVSSQFGAGGDFEGWRHATLAEVGVLLTNMDIGLPLDSFPSDSFVDDGGISGRGAMAFLGSSGGGNYTFGIVADAFITSSSQQAVYIGVTPMRTVLAGDIAYGNAANYPDFGSVLVRSSVGAVPEPTSLICWLGLGLVGLSRRRKS